MRAIVITDHPFSLPSLQVLVQKDILEGIATTTSNKDLLIQLRRLSKEVGIPLVQLQPRKMEQQLGVFLRKEKANVVFVFGFSHKIGGRLLQLPTWGFINFHPSQLPQFRGPNPAFWQIKNQVQQGGITAHKIDKDWDTGEIIGMLPIPILPEMTTSRYLSEAGFYAAQLMNMLIAALQAGQLPSQQQDTTMGSYQKSPRKADLRIQWETQSVAEINALVNACNSALGGAIAMLRQQPLQILEVSLFEGAMTAKVGAITHLKPLVVACKGGQVLKIEIVQVAEGIMSGERFAEMAQLKVGEVLG